jgi:ornithine cyclodeaminase/alanine dehydrogenase-like protein (mu-crystallin family)
MPLHCEEIVEVSMRLRILSGEDVEKLLPISQAIEQMRKAFGDLSSGRAVMPMRSCVETDAGDIHVMPAYLKDTALSVKMVLTYPGNRERNLPVVQGLISVFDPATGTPRAMMDCGRLTAIRTAAGGGLAIELLARRDSRVLLLIGAGVQGRMQAEAALATRDIRQIFVTDVYRATAEEFRAALADRPDAPEVTVVDSADEVVEQADIIVTATTSCVPTFDGRLLRPGTHVTAIGAYRPERRELDTHTVEKAYVVVDSRRSAAAEAGDLIIPKREPDAELGEIVNQTAPGRSDSRQITLFKSVGVAVQDAAAAGWVLQQAEAQDVGMLVEV